MGMTKPAPVPILNSYLMVTKSKNDIFKPKALALVIDLSIQEPSCFTKAFQI